MDPTDVFIVQAYGSPIVEKQLLNAVMDNSGNTICWTEESLAQQWIDKHLPGRNFMVVRKKLNEWRFELHELKRDHSIEASVRIISTVDY